ncbi:uncharacterized protein [Henckelia pumila]|uniref:uncharacterized protein n=1 Tax=Henckelia pumila TaxID=405737 RepID=UPI003C6DBD48
MYKDLFTRFWLKGMKHIEYQYDSEYWACQQINTEHRQPGVDRLTKSTHFIPYNRYYSFDRMDRFYIQEIVRFHGVPVSIVNDRDHSLALSPYLSSIHDVLYVSLLRRYVADDSHILQPSEVHLDTDLTYVERPLRILDHKVKMLRTKAIPLVLVQWQRQRTEEVTWELEIRMRADYP